MKKIGILHGMEFTFPEAFVERVNSLGLKNIMAEKAHVDVVSQGADSGYAVLLDRISQDIPFYRAYVKNAAISGTEVINNPFWWSADEKFFNNALATKIGVPVPKTVLLPSNERPPDTSESSFRNLAFPLSWDAIFEHIGWPAYMKPHSGGGWKSVFKLENREEFFEKFHETGQLVMMLQEEIIFDEYYRCYCIGGDNIRIMQYEPRTPHHLRYVHGKFAAGKELMATMQDYVYRINKYLGYDFNTVELAVRNGIPYAIDFCNPAPDADVNSVGQENFDWVVNAAADFAVKRAESFMPNRDNLTWGEFVGASVAKRTLFEESKKKLSSATASNKKVARVKPATRVKTKTAKKESSKKVS